MREKSIPMLRPIYDDQHWFDPDGCANRGMRAMQSGEIEIAPLRLHARPHAVERRVIRRGAEHEFDDR